MAASAAWSAAVAKFARPAFRVTIAMSSMAIASPTVRAVSAAKAARSARRSSSAALRGRAGLRRAPVG